MWRAWSVTHNISIHILDIPPLPLNCTSVWWALDLLKEDPSKEISWRRIFGLESTPVEHRDHPTTIITCLFPFWAVLIEENWATGRLLPTDVTFRGLLSCRIEYQQLIIKRVVPILKQRKELAKGPLLFYQSRLWTDMGHNQKEDMKEGFIGYIVETSASGYNNGAL